MNIGFSEQASDSYTGGQDGKRMPNGNNTDFYSLIPEDMNRYAIQTQSEFNENKTIPLGLEIFQAGNYQIALDHAEGVFNQGQKIYLEDTYQNIIHNLSEEAYSFSQETGDNINDRFILRFTSTALSNEETALNQVRIYPNPSTDVFYINYAGSEKLTFTIYDLTGKKVLMGTGTDDGFIQVE
jgi:protease II